MKLSDCRPLDEIFEHTDTDAARTFRRFNATQMYEYAVSHDLPIVHGWLDPAQTQFIRENRGIEPWKLQRLCEPYLSRPILLVHMADGSHLTVDGHHRWIRLAELGRRWIDAYIFEVGRWEPFLIAGVTTLQLIAPRPDPHI